MAAGRIKGIPVEIGGDTTKLQTALKGVNTELKNTQSQLKDVEKLLKDSVTIPIDPLLPLGIWKKREPEAITETESCRQEDTAHPDPWRNPSCK